MKFRKKKKNNILEQGILAILLIGIVAFACSIPSKKPIAIVEIVSEEIEIEYIQEGN